MSKATATTALGKIQAVVRELSRQVEENARDRRELNEIRESLREVRFELSQMRDLSGQIVQGLALARKPSFMTPQELAKELQVDEKTVRNMFHDGRLPGIRISERSIRFDRSAVYKAIMKEKE